MRDLKASDNGSLASLVTTKRVALVTTKRVALVTTS